MHLSTNPPGPRVRITAPEAGMVQLVSDTPFLERAALVKRIAPLDRKLTPAARTLISQLCNPNRPKDRSQWLFDEPPFPLSV